MSMLFCSWAGGKEEEDPGSGGEESGEENDAESTSADAEETTDGTEAAVAEPEPEEEKKPAAPAFFCKWATEDDAKSESEGESDNNDNNGVEDEQKEEINENEEKEPEKDEIPPSEKPDKPVMFMKWAKEGDDEVESSSEEEEEENDAKLEPESEEESQTEKAPAAEENGSWMVRMVEDAGNDLLGLPLAPSPSEDQDPFDSVFSSSKPGPAKRKSKPAAKIVFSDSDDDNHIPDVDTSNFEVIDSWDAYVADTVSETLDGNEEKKAKGRPRGAFSRGPYKKKEKPGPKSAKPGPKSKRASRRSPSLDSMVFPTSDLDLSSIRLNVRNDVVVTAAERRLANTHVAKMQEMDEEEDVPLARRRSKSGRKRKGEGAEGKKAKKSKIDSLADEVGWPRMSSVFSDSDEGKRVRKPTAKVQPFVHVEPEKEKKRTKPKDRKMGRKVHLPAKGPYYTACKLGSYRCPLCFMEWRLNQPYGRHIIGQACQVDPPGPNKKREDEDEDKALRFVSVTPATAKRDSSVKIGKVPSLKFLSREATWETLDSMPRVKEGLEYYHSLYSPYNRTVQPRLFRHIRGGAKLNYVAGLTGYEKLCREPLKIAIYLERKISLARGKLGARHPRTRGWVAKYRLLLALPLHDLFLVAASPYRVLEYPTDTGEVGLMCLACPKADCGGCPKVTPEPVKRSERPTKKSSSPKITLKIKKEVIEKKHKKDKKFKKDKKDKKKERVELPSGLVMTCSSCSTVFNSVTGLGEHRRLCKAK